MKKSFKAMLISGVASLLTATILLVSGGSTIAIAILGGTGICFVPGALKLNDITQEGLRKKHNTGFSQKVDYERTDQIYVPNTEQSNSSEKTVYLVSPEKIGFTYEKSNDKKEDILEQYLIYELETTDALSEEEKVNRLVRKRKKETEEKLSRTKI